ncbi:transglutaminase-like putative cysteine protease [Lipingzhangella halophila]|uniref:Transglutaminase-like putative cysteine protease n=1 Tax=Lipingzhangella halophila TaxID=1783352 RepID=A0A7W7RFV2_9ACTN|nr:transglutaminaseTgpA domain-containing protein [Lipingzhangella halophila]MBB4931132.1 transglutaminase-like putative cysteine protease [Lipingzhangella halophila]
MRRLAGYAALASCAAAPGLALAPAYAEPVTVAATLSVWAVAGVLVAGLLRRYFPAPAVLLLGLPVAFAGTAVLVAVFPGAATSVWWGTLDAVANSGARILTTALPTTVAADTLALPALAIWLSGVAAALAYHSDHPLAAVTCPLLALVGAAVLNGPEVRHAYLPTALFALAAVLLLALSAGGATGPRAAEVRVATKRAVRAGRLSRALALGCVVAVVATLTTYIGPLALYGSAVSPADLRAVVTPPEEDTSGASPLSYLPEWAAEPGEHLLTVTADEPTDLRWATLSDFDGITWRPESRYRSAAEELPAPETVVPDGPNQEVTVEVDALPGHWLPVVGVPRHVSGASVAYAPESTTLRTADGSAEDAEYTVIGQVPSYEEENLNAAGEPDKEQFERYLRFPEDPPEQITEIAERFSDGTPYQRANRLAGYLRGNYGFDPESSGGHGYANLDTLLVAPGEKGGGGTSEQFASAFALLARASGLPSRVVVGFGPGTAEDDQTYTVRTGDAVAWGEVYLEGVGWAPFDVTPGDPKENGASAVSDAGGGGAADESWDGGSPEEDTDESEASGAFLDVTHAWWTVGWVGTGLLAALVAGALFTTALRAVRRRLRLTAGPPEKRLTGAWWELRDEMRLARAGPLPSDTVADVLARCDELLPPPEGRDRRWTLATTMNAMAFMGPAGAHGERVSADAAHRAVDEVRTYTADLRAAQSHSRRLLWWTDPRPLFWGRR